MAMAMAHLTKVLQRKSETWPYGLEWWWCVLEGGGGEGFMTP